MKSMGQTTIDRLLTLSQLELSDQEKDKLADNLNSIIQFIEIMNEVPTDSVEPLSHPIDMEQSLRVDQAQSDVEREQVLDIAPSTEEGLFLVPKVIEQR